MFSLAEAQEGPYRSLEVPEREPESRRDPAFPPGNKRQDKKRTVLSCAKGILGWS